VGTAKTLPDSFTPRRLPRHIIATKKTASPMRTGALSLKSNAEPMASTPDEIDTATVSV
jgi:hypothetical protein